MAKKFRLSLFQNKYKDSIGRFMLRISIKENGCWEMNSGVRDNGYSRININKKSFYGHRFFYEYFNGKIKTGNFICHKCDNRKCVNPNHLFQGTQKDNIQDAINKKRFPVGSRLSKKLTEDDIIEIRSSNECNEYLASMFGVCRQTISLIKRRKTWKHV